MCSVFIDNFLLNNCHCLGRLKLWQSRNTHREKEILLKDRWGEKSHCFSQMLGLYVLISLAIKCPSPSAQYLAKQKSHLLHKTL